ncbi:PPOX class F420-dependent oxidoreductase [Micromonospora sp. NBC_01796]|uniref:PPOX class F420-dependent oxidoreductase n=1 Tax=Micromonospora sp. NBC_01796 TaxID=2975987 RepID=UPI002DDBDE2C|nr:PPOX class F420-dependent oxidoreductase [Micromonospora sp. NBC_01796]WSA86313.1 PPOX class F420-dependent oxidoreductase [Micromonospora sp. NBC_01796]
MTTEPTVPSSHADLLERPLFTHLATVRPDGAPQSSLMWFVWDGERIRMTHTRGRQKFRNLAHDPRVALSIADPEDGYRSLELRGVVESIDPDDEQASFYQSLQRRYGAEGEISDIPNRVVVTIRPTRFVAVTGGAVQPQS